MDYSAIIGTMNNPTAADHSSSSNTTNKGAEAFLFIFIFGGMFLALIVSAIGLYYLNKTYPKLFSSVRNTLTSERSLSKTSPTNNSYTQLNTERNTNRGVVTVNDIELEKYMNNSTGTESQSPNSSTYTQPCYAYKIESGELKSNNCYTPADYTLITDYYNRYRTADWSYDGANSSIEFLCEGKDFFKDACEDAQARKEQAAESKQKYIDLGLAVIARGTPVN